MLSSDSPQRALAPLLDVPSTSAVLTDFDGTLAPIVGDPAEARPVEGAPRLLADLAARFGSVAVVSGRPVSFLRTRLLPDAWAGGPASRVQLVGLYGLERLGPDGEISLEPAAAAWLPVLQESAAHFAAAAPSGVLVEPKGATLTLHWRRVPEAEPWAEREVAAEVARTGLAAFPGRMSVELRPPLQIDKGTVVRELATGSTAACYFGDDLGDLPAFAALADLAASGGPYAVSVAVVDDETPAEVAAAADVRVAGPSAAFGLLRWLADAAAPGDAGVDEGRS